MLLNSIFAVLILFANPIYVMAQELHWEDIDYSPELKRNKFIWTKASQTQKARYLELYRAAIQYCIGNIGKPTSEVDSSIAGSRIKIFSKITFETISMLYGEYGDLKVAAEWRYKDWTESNHAPELLNADENSDDYVTSGFWAAGMYKELDKFYSTAYPQELKWLKDTTDIGLLDKDPKKYALTWPLQAKEHRRFLENWARAKKLARTEKPKLLDPAVQTHEWFYSDKPDEVMKALEYYHANKVGFMLEKALSHKDPKVAAKTKEYLEDLKNTGTK